MSDAARLLELIEDHVVEHGGDLGGWTRREEDLLQLFDGRVTLRAELHDAGEGREELAHAHVYATLHDHDEAVLDACVFGIGADRESALGEAALIWMTCVAGPIRSFIDDRPVCMTCQAGAEGGDPSAGYSSGDYGLPGLRAFVGPAISRGFDDEERLAELDDGKPWFRHAFESAAPRRVHLAKATIVSTGGGGWRRELEIDGHDVSHQDPGWPGGVDAPECSYVTRFAVFEFPQGSTELARRAELERAIHHFAEQYAAYESIERLEQEMIDQGFDPDVVKEVESISTIAFGRTLFEQHGVQYAPTVIRARADGRVETDVPLMSLPAYTRGRAIAAKLAERMSEEAFFALCCYNAESQTILQVLETHGEELDLGGLTMYPCVVPDRATSDATMEAAMARLHELVEAGREPAKKPWWKFW